MRIRAFHIDGFGILFRITVEDLPRGLGIFLGNNEAGKSTCLEFFRTMLTGYPLPRSKDAKHGWAQAGQRQGGSLVLDLAEGRNLRLSRQPGPNGGVASLFDEQGNTLDIKEYLRLLAGVDREVYRNIYGFSLTELQTFASLDSEAVRNALYGVGFGVGLNAPGLAMTKLQSSMDDLFKPNGKNPPLNAALRQWDELQRQIQEAEKSVSRYDAMAGELAQNKARLQALQDEKFSLEEERRGLDRRLGIWKQWEEWQLSQTRLGRLDPVTETFPLDGPARLERVLN